MTAFNPGRRRTGEELEEPAPRTPTTSGREEGNQRSLEQGPRHEVSQSSPPPQEVQRQASQRQRWDAWGRCTCGPIPVRPPNLSHRSAAPIPRGDELLTVSQAGEYLGTGERFIRRLVSQRRISYIKLGKY